jgi:DNA-binding transcriptional MerR regulator
MEEKSQLFSISQVSERLNIPKHTLRFWEKELNGLVVALRTNGGQRRYTVPNLLILKEIKRYRDNGYGLPEIVEKINQNCKIEPPSPIKIELLMNRVAEVVRKEVYNFFKEEKGTE